MDLTLQGEHPGSPHAFAGEGRGGAVACSVVLDMVIVSDLHLAALSWTFAEGTGFSWGFLEDLVLFSECSISCTQS